MVRRPQGPPRRGRRHSPSRPSRSGWPPVGTGNIAGVAIAITLGGPGAVFWMWVIAAIGMAPLSSRATLRPGVQGPLVRRHLPGGPASTSGRAEVVRWGATFAVALLFTFGIALRDGPVQHHRRETLRTAHGVPTRITRGRTRRLSGAVISAHQVCWRAWPSGWPPSWRWSSPALPRHPRDEPRPARLRVLRDRGIRLRVERGVRGTAAEWSRPC
jgi:hypothetical protein